jgi:two-component system LytT family sensor kinase
MSFFRKYIFPPLYGLTVYFTIRLLNDSVSGKVFWDRSWKLNFTEQAWSVVMGFVVLWIFDRLFRWFDNRWESQLSYTRLAKELGYLILLNVVLQNLVLTPLAAFTDDGLQWADFVLINTVPLLYALIYYGVTHSHKFLQSYINGKVQLEKIMNDHLRTELKFLRAQYHPHFLFNALNAIYFQMDENVEEAKKTVEKFSELLRYQLYDQHQTVPISREIHYLENFIALQKLRSSARLELETSFDGLLNGEQVYPLLFQPLVENAFKYVGGDYLIKISLCKREKDIFMTVENSMHSAASPEISSGIGLANLKRRLELLYPDKHHFTAGPTGTSFFAQLSITVDS